ncbi:MAG: hypothetical protein IT389_02090 [Nitrospira sp.]|nr:hypothetical protein [Nitrospira sp.]
MIGRESLFTWLAGAALCAGAIGFSTNSMASPIDHLTDLTGKVTVIVTLTGRDNFTSEYRYDVSVRNLTADPLIADSLIVTLDKITNLAGEDHEGLTNEPFLNRFDILGQDGETDEGKPFFRIPPGSTADVGPQTNSRAAAVRIRNRDYVAVFTPGFKVYGSKRPPPEAKPPATQAQPAAAQRQTDKQTERLLQLLLKKGVITEEEWRKANQP